MLQTAITLPVCCFVRPLGVESCLSVCVCFLLYGVALKNSRAYAYRASGRARERERGRDGWMDGWTDRRTDRRMDGWMGGGMDREKATGR